MYSVYYFPFQSTCITTMFSWTFFWFVIKKANKVDFLLKGKKPPTQQNNHQTKQWSNLIIVKQATKTGTSYTKAHKFQEK